MPDYWSCSPYVPEYANREGNTHTCAEIQAFKEGECWNHIDSYDRTQLRAAWSNCLKRGTPNSVAYEDGLRQAEALRREFDALANNMRQVFASFW